MFSKKTIKGLIKKYKVLYGDVTSQLESVGMESDSAYRCVKSLSNDYKLKLSILEGILTDIEMGYLGDVLKVDDLVEVINDSNLNDALSNVLKVDCSEVAPKNKGVSLDSSTLECSTNSLGLDKGIDGGIEVATKSGSGLVCTFKGYGYNEIYGYDMSDVRYKHLESKVENLIVKLIEDKGVRVFLTGGSLGFDKLVYFIIDRLKVKYPYIENRLAIPFLDQPSKWTAKNIEDYKYMKSKADGLVYVDGLEGYNTTNSQTGEFHSRKLGICHEYMIDNSDVLVTLYRGESNGPVSYCINYAKKKNLKGVININPDVL